MQDLAGLRVPRRILVLRLIRRQHAQGLHGELGPEGQRLERGDQRIAPEERAEPRDAGREIPLTGTRTVVHEQAQVGDRALHDQVEQFVVAGHRGRAALPGVVRGHPFVRGDPRGGREQGTHLRAGRGFDVGPVGGSRPRGGPHRPAQVAHGAGRELDGPAQVHLGARLVARRRGDLGSIREGDVGALLDPIQAVIPERHPAVRDRDGQRSATGGSGVATNLEDVRRVGTQVQLQSDGDGPLGVVDDPDALQEALGPDEPIARDPDRPAGEFAHGMDLGVGVAVGGRVGHDDAAPEVAPHRTLEQDRSIATDPEHRARQQSTVALVQAQPARVGMDVSEGVGQEVDVAVLEDLDGTQVGRPGDRSVAGRQEPDVARERQIGCGRGIHHGIAHREPVPSSPPVTAPSRSAWSAMTSASIRSSMSPSITPGRLCTVLPIRWSVTRSCGKL